MHLPHDQTKNVDPNAEMARGVDVFIHELILPPELLTMKNAGLTYPPAPGTSSSFDAGVQQAKNIESSSHTPQGAFGYLLTQINPKPKLSVVVHFPAADDTVKCAYKSVKAHFPNGIDGCDLSGDATIRGALRDYSRR